MESWRLEHPDYGVVDLHIARLTELRELDPEWPEDEADKGEDGAEDADDPEDAGDAEDPGDVGEDPQGSDGVLQRLDQRWEAAKDRGVLALVGGVPRARLKALSSTVIDIDRDLKPGKYSPGAAKRNGAHLKISANFLNEVREITFRDGKDTVLFEPPPGSPAERRYRAMEESPWKRVVYPISAGMGKVGWAIAVIILLPFIQRLISWLLGLLPDIDWPEIPWPDIDWPEIPWPEINLPDIDWPEINLPDIDLPGWMLWMIDNSRLWAPIVIGVVIGVVALRTARKSRRTRRKWSSDGTEKGGDNDPTGDPEEDEGDTKAQD